jgi:DNA repair protein RecO (recombination protein O)
MLTTKVRALVIKEYEAGEADKRLLLLCKGQGRVMAYARGARKPRSKFMAAAQIFTYSDFVLAQGRGFFSVAQADVIENFYNLRTDYDRLCAALRIAEVCDKTILENTNCDELLKLVLKSLSNLSKEKFPPSQITSVFLLRFFDFYGLRPRSEECAVCNLPIAEMGETNGGLFWGAEGLMCAKCEAFGNVLPQVLKLSKSAAVAVSFILNSELAKSFAFDAHDSVLAELNDAAELLWRFHFK